jgi:hypothetical protein
MSEAYCIMSENIISLHTAVFRDDGYVATLHLISRHECEAGKVTWVFRRRLSFAERVKRVLFDWNRAKLEFHLRLDDFPTKPAADFIWSDNGLSVAILIKQEPLAFIHEASRTGYSKCLKHVFGANLWDEDLYRETFP